LKCQFVLQIDFELTLHQHQSTNSSATSIHTELHRFCTIGGPEILTQHAGHDATAEFEEVFHSQAARNQLLDYAIGTLKGYNGSAIEDGLSQQSKNANPASTTANGAAQKDEKCSIQ
jgi:hypothetical protein